MSKLCPLCENTLIEIDDFYNIKLFGLSATEILYLKEFYVNATGDMELKTIHERISERGFKG